MEDSASDGTPLISHVSCSALGFVYNTTASWKRVYTTGDTCMHTVHNGRIYVVRFYWVNETFRKTFEYSVSKVSGPVGSITVSWSGVATNWCSSTLERCVGLMNMLDN